MRPVSKTTCPIESGFPKKYKPHSIAKTDLEINLDNYCSYCEVYSSDLEVEHVISRHQDDTLTNSWDNFLLACGRCNGRDNKSNKNVDTTQIHFPHLNNTMLSFIYAEGGFVKVNPSLTDESFIHANNLMDLVGLDKIPGNPKYPQLNLNDTRWKHRRLAWESATDILSEYLINNLSAKQVVDFAIQRGFFSVWFSVFIDHPLIKEILITRFKGTCEECFDVGNNFNLINRNVGNLTDPI